MVAQIGVVEQPGGGGTEFQRLALNLGTANGGFGPFALATLAVDGNGNTIGATNGFPIVDGYAAPVNTNWTSGTSANTALTSTTQGMDTVVVTYVPSGSITGGQITFEVFDGATWVPIKGFRAESYVSDQVYALNGATTRAWQFSVAGFPQFRTRLSSALTGAGNATLTHVVTSAPDVSGVTVGIDPTQGSSKTKLSSAASTNATNVKAAAGVVTGVYALNTNAAARYVKLYDKASAPTVGTDTPFMTILAPATGDKAPPIPLPGIACTAGISFAITANAADTDNTAVGAGDVLLTLIWN